MDEPNATRQEPKWWSRPRRVPDRRTQPAETRSAETGPAAVESAREQAAEAAAGGSAAPGSAGPEAQAAAGEPAAAPAACPEPLHGVDPYSTPPYGGPGPWAPAPPVLRPPVTPPRGVALPPGSTTPPNGVPAEGSGSAAVPPVDQRSTGAPESGGPSRGPEPQPVPQSAVPPLPPRPPARPRPGGRGIALGALVLALVAGGAGGLIGAYIERNGSVSDIELPRTAAAEGGARPKGSIAGIARQTLPGVVTLHARGGGAEATGTGFVLDRRGHILTNHHVVEGAESADGVRVTFDGGQTATGEVVGGDAGYDLAVVQVSHVSGLTPLPLGDSDAVRVGDPVIAFGAPFDLDGTVTTGIVSATERPITAGGGEPGSELSYVNALQTDAPMNPGNSGGPLVDARGRVVGVNSAIRGAGGAPGLSGGEGGGSVGLGFAIPVNQARRIAEELINEGRATHPVIGVSLDMRYEGEGARIGGTGGRGAVVPGGPADRAGLAAGDVITEVGGKPVTGGEELIVRIRSHRPGEKLELTVLGGGAEGARRTVRVTLGSATG
ncbi:trypsin-like peptidase domain-containing protein [Streptomyces sp. WMMB303]|uniref:S1C family serine protease n=1 Tax=Streptomyces sp. WMMB303 TaxID=3034154 RepID=UPI0023EC8EFF|nr:trypsin-like peptidase domain-containing protein [Streptomyces sp. WMMB303]MDF4253584.1 trypsin-like peptidase domain-containing protein [Streptomyces sp. WMMB303]